jgi:DNA-binding NarL/FixJ family response regulator
LNSHRREIPLHDHSRPPDIEYLLRAEWSLVADAAHLTANQQSVFEKRLSGWTFEEIGRQRGHSKQAAQNIFRQALKKLVRAWFADPLHGLADVYRQETLRGLKSRPRR